MKLDIGCDSNKKEGFIGVDKFKLKGVDILADINKRLPFKINSVDAIYCSHVLMYSKNIDFTLKEFYRVCKPGAIIEIKVPHFSSHTSVSEFTLIRFRYMVLFSGYIKNSNHYEAKEKNEGLFIQLDKKLVFEKGPLFFYNRILEPIFNKIPHYYERSFLKALFPAYEIYLKLKVVK